MILPLQIFFALGAVLLLARAINLTMLMRWYARPRPPGSTVTVEGRRVYCTVKGEGSPVVVIEAALGTTSAEWWGIQDALAKKTRVLTYDRAGYGWSEYVDGPRTSRQIARELKELLETEEIEGPLVMVGHSFGGLLVNHFARLFPALIAGVVLIDPLSPDDGRFRADLQRGTYRRSGLDKTPSLKMQAYMNGFGFLRLFKRMVLKSEYFLPFRTLPREVLDVVWHHLLLTQTPQNALNEFVQARIARNNADLKAPGTFPLVPLTVLTHSSEKMRQSLVRKGKLTQADAEKTETLWQELIREHCALSPKSKLVVASESGHAIHLEQPQLVTQSVLDIVDTVRRGARVGG
jgi:pimeloyl-ACP methyl ester carboxylesterase